MKWLFLSLVLLMPLDLIAAEPGVFVAVGYGGRRMISTDGIEWTISTEWAASGGDDANNLMGLAYGKGKFVAVGGGSGSKDKPGGHILVSADGKTWREVFTRTFRVNPIAFGNDRFVVGGPDRQLYYSDDGETWTAGPKIEFTDEQNWAFWFRRGAFGGGRFVFIGNSGKDQKQHWAMATTQGEKVESIVYDLPPVRDIAFGNGRFVVVGPGGLRMSSTDGKTWEHKTTDAPANLDHIAFNGSEFLASGQGTLYRSADGKTWTKSKNRTPANIVAARGDLLIGTTWPGQMWSSTDNGTTWAKHKTLTPNGINHVVFGEAKPVKKPSPAPAGFVALRGFVDQYCSRCHSNTTTKGGVNLAPHDTLLKLSADRKLWRAVQAEIVNRTMPPEDAKTQPTAEARAAAATWLKQTLDDAEQDDRARPDPGRTVVRRLTRDEYNRSVRDLLGVDADIAAAVGMPEDTVGDAFENLSSALSVSDSLMEKYFAAAELIIEKLSAKNPKAPKAPTLLDTLLGKPDPAAAEELIAKLMRRAYRRPIAAHELGRMTKFFASRLASGAKVPEAIAPVLKAILVSPNFLFRIERDRGPDANTAYRISDHELAVRLSYFLWSSLPDDELNRLADAGTLHEPNVLENQVKRMLADSKAEALGANFATQWLHLNKLAEARPSTEFFPTFTPRLREAMRTETLMVFNHLRSADRPITDLLSADYTFANAELAKHYGWKSTSGARFEKITITDPNRGGLLGMGSVLSMTSHTNRTSPTLRGKYVLDVILGTPPPPPPPNVGEADDAKGAKDVKTFREKLALHASQSACANCHAKIDPLGFGLENFDAVGRWRNPSPLIDASGKLPSGEQFRGAAELKAVLQARQPQFITNLSRKMLIYALGRELTSRDDSSIEAVTKELSSHENRFSTFILGVVKSYPFQHRKNAALDVADE